MPKALVTGARGFIGQYLIKELVKRGITPITLPHTGMREIDHVLANFPPDYIFHLAAHGNMANQASWDETVKANVDMTYKLLYATRHIPYKAFINTSSSSVLLPHQTIYSATKAAGEFLCAAFIDTLSKPITTIRPYSVYGIGEAPYRFIPTVFRSCMYGEEMVLDPTPVHDWIYVEDLVRLMVDLALREDEEEGDIVNAGTGVGTSNSSIVTLIEGITAKKANITIANVPLRPFDNASWVCDLDEAMELWNGKYISLQQGLQQIYDTIKREVVN